MSFLRSSESGVEIDIQVIPRAARSEIVGLHDDRLKIRLNSPPVDGAANKELIKLLSKKSGVAKGRISIIRGQTSRLKAVLLLDLDLVTAKRKFAAWIQG